MLINNINMHLSVTNADHGWLLLIININMDSSVTNDDHGQLTLIININTESSVTIDYHDGSDLIPVCYGKSLGTIWQIVYELITPNLQKYVLIFHKK